jgi:hypothetical protein
MTKPSGSTSAELAPEAQALIHDHPPVAIANTDIELKLNKRIAELRSEFAAEQNMLTDMETKANELKATLLRISGAIQVLEEMLTKLAQDAPKEGKQ